MTFYPVSEDIKTELDPGTMQIPSDILRGSLFQYELGDKVARKILGYCKEAGQWVGVSKISLMAVALREARQYNDTIQQHRDNLDALLKERDAIEESYNKERKRYELFKYLTLGFSRMVCPLPPVYQFLDEEIRQERAFLYCNDGPAANIDWLITGIKGLEKLGLLSVVWQEIKNGYHDDVIYPTGKLVALIRVAIDIETEAHIGA